MAQPVRRVCAGSQEPLPEAPRLGRFASVRARGRVPAPAPALGTRSGDQPRSEQSQPTSARLRGPREGDSRPGGGPGLAKRAGCSQAGRRAMEEQRGSGQPSPESQAPLRNRESRGRRAPGSSSQAQNSVGSRQRVPGAPARGARPPLHPEVCPSLLGPIVLPRFLSPSPPLCRGLPLRSSGSAPSSPSSSLPPALPSSSPALPPSSLPLSTPLSSGRPHFLSRTRTQTQPPSPRSGPSASLSRLLSLSLLQALQPFKMLPLGCDSPDAAPRPPARSPAPSVARFLSLALPLPTSDLLH